MKLSGSRYHHALLCAWPYRPDVEVPPQPSGAAARLGTAVHALVDAHVSGRAEPDLPELLEAAPIARQAIAWLGKREKPHASEIAIAYDPTTDTARLLDVSGGHRAYGKLAPTEIPTTLDLLWLHEGHVVVADLKTGKKANAHPEQLYLQALAATRLLDRPRAHVHFVWARKTKCEADAPEELGPGELEVESWRASSLVRRLPVAQPQPGDGCWFCPAKPACPAHAAPTEQDRAEALV